MGIPQGSPLSPILYIFYNADLPEPPWTSAERRARTLLPVLPGLYRRRSCFGGGRILRSQLRRSNYLVRKGSKTPDSYIRITLFRAQIPTDSLRTPCCQDRTGKSELGPSVLITRERWGHSSNRRPRFSETSGSYPRKETAGGGTHRLLTRKDAQDFKPLT